MNVLITLKDYGKNQGKEEDYLTGDLANFTRSDMEMNQPEDLEEDVFAELTTVDGHIKVLKSEPLTLEIAKKLLNLVEQRMKE